ncbi:MAG: Na/Pi cotransporter family protein [Methylobacterium mesophilicum]|nr:Na/Pi cotransporter family protein [Methylobacterium mesophilicum]
MSGSTVLLHLAGAVALLLWATRMVRTGVERAYGEVLRKRLRETMGNPLPALLVGTSLAIALQSSTAVTLLIGSFAGSGLVTGVAGLLAVRGAELGSALVVKLLSFDLTLLAPTAILAGTVTIMVTERREWRQLGRILVGVGLLVFSLDLLAQATAPLRESPMLGLIVRYLAGDPVTAFLLAALLTWSFHSSIAAVLFLVTLASHGVLTPELGVVMVLGVNLGSSVIAPLLTRAAPAPARVVPLGNLLMRGAGSVLMLGLFLLFTPRLGFLGTDGGERIVNAHILFNAMILVAGLPLARLVERAATALANLGTKPEMPSLAAREISALDEGVLDVPQLALANATRELVPVCETVEVMLERAHELYGKPEKAGIDALRALDDRVDARQAAIKLYLAKASTQKLSEGEAQRCRELIEGCVKLEQVGDIIANNLLAHLRKQIARGLAYTSEGFEELSELHAEVLANARLAFNVLIARDLETARLLVSRKERLRKLERQSSRSHFLRLSEGAKRSVETSAIHLDTIRDLKQINSLLASIAYPVLEENGLLRDTRLRAAE